MFNLFKDVIFLQLCGLKAFVLKLVIKDFVFLLSLEIAVCFHRCLNQRLGTIVWNIVS